MKALKNNKPLHQYLLSVTAVKSARPFDSYTKEELMKVYKDQVKKDWEILKQL